MRKENKKYMVRKVSALQLKPQNNQWLNILERNVQFI